MTMGGGEADYHMGVRAEKVLDRFTVTKKKKKKQLLSCLNSVVFSKELQTRLKNKYTAQLGARPHWGYCSTEPGAICRLGNSNSWLCRAEGTHGLSLQENEHTMSPSCRIQQSTMTLTLDPAAGLALLCWKPWVDGSRLESPWPQEGWWGEPGNCLHLNVSFLGHQANLLNHIWGIDSRYLDAIPLA